MGRKGMRVKTGSIAAVAWGGRAGHAALAIRCGALPYSLVEVALSEEVIHSLVGKGSEDAGAPRPIHIRKSVNA